MKASVKAAWVKDLRDNPDAQGRSLLDYINAEGERRQCCLGRLSLLAVAAGVIPPPELHDNEYRYLNGHPSGGESFCEASGLPRKVSEWAGLDPAKDDVIIEPADGDDPALTAIGANDGMGLTFAEIADLVEQNVPADE